MLSLDVLPGNIWICLFFSVPAILLLYRSHSNKAPNFPVANAFPWDFTRRKAYAAYMQNSKELLSQVKTTGGPITIITPSGPRIILPSSLSEWVKNNKDLDHQEMVRRDFFADYPGFEGNAMIHDSNNVLIDTIKRHLSQNKTLVPVVNTHVAEALDDIWTKEENWHSIPWFSSTTGLISRAAASIFVGPDLARDPEWQRKTVLYATSFFTAVFELKRWPSFTRPVVHWFLPAAKECRRLVKEVRKTVESEKKKKKKQSPGEANLDAIAWSEKIAVGRDLDQGAVQLGFAVAAFHTTSEALRQVLLDIGQHPELVEPLRREIQESIESAGGVSAMALSKMQLLDSVLKESQRLQAPAIVNLERQALRPTHLPDGTLIPAGTVIDVDGSDMWDPTIYPNPTEFNGYRFLTKLQSGDTQAAYVSSTKEQCVFGMGRHICPGRFFAAMELKVCLAHVLMKYDVRLEEGCVPRSVKNGFYQMVDPGARVEVRRRKEESGVLAM